MIVRPAPPRARQRRQHVMVVRRRALPAVGGVEIMMLGRVGVAGEADGEAAAFEQGEERLPVLQVLIGFVVEKSADRDVHHDDDQRVFRRMGEHVAHELELPLVEPALVLAPSPGLMWIEARDSSTSSSIRKSVWA